MQIYVDLRHRIVSGAHQPMHCTAITAAAAGVAPAECRQLGGILTTSASAADDEAFFLAADALHRALMG